MRYGGDRQPAQVPRDPLQTPSSGQNLEYLPPPGPRPFLCPPNTPPAHSFTQEPPKALGVNPLPWARSPAQQYMDNKGARTGRWTHGSELGTQGLEPNRGEIQIRG